MTASTADRVESMLDAFFSIIKRIPVPETVGVDFFATKYGITSKTVRKHPWLLPNFGVSELPGVLSWRIETALDWLSVPADEHRRQWDALSSRARAAIMRRRRVRG